MEQIKCPKCEKCFSTATNLQKHIQKKKPCDTVIECEKCKMKFKYIRDKHRHINRKTPCEPVIGNPMEQTPKNACRFCGRQMASSQTLKNHYNTCHIKNGGMNKLFDKIKTQDDTIKMLVAEVMILKKNMVQPKTHIEIHDSNHHNTNIDIQFINFSSDEHMKQTRQILQTLAPTIINAPKETDIPRIQQITDRIGALVTGAFRDPNNKKLQGVYYSQTNAFVYDDDKWHIREQKELSQELIRKIYDYVDSTKSVKKKDDVLSVMKHLFVLGGCGESDIQKMSEQEQIALYAEMGKKLCFKTITIV
jgi:CRISPR/Cas system CSM-associated protein Csm2 small subunit